MALEYFYGLIPKTINILPTVNVFNQGGNPGIAGPQTFYFHFTLKNQNGYNQTSNGVLVNLPGGQNSRIEIILPSTIKPSPEVDVKEVVLSISTNGQASNSTILKTYDLSTITLPYVDILINAQDIQPTINTAYVISVYTGNGFFQPLNAIAVNSLSVIYYGGAGGPSQVTKFTLLNGEDENLNPPILGGSVITLEVYLDAIRADALFTRKLQYILYGYYRSLDGSITTTNLSRAGIWYDWDAADPLIKLDVPIPAGYGAYIGVRANFDINSIPEIGFNSFVQFIPKVDQPKGIFSPALSLYNNSVLPDKGKVKFLPKKNAFIKNLDGTAVIDNYLTPYISAKVHQVINPSNTQNRYGWIDINGNVGVAQNLSSVPTGARSRAIFNTVSGESLLNNWTNFISTNNNVISISGQLSDVFRSDYPDITLAGKSFPTEVYFNATHLNHYIQQSGTGIIRRFRQDITPLTITGTYNYVFNIADFNSGDVVNSAEISGLQNSQNAVGFFTPYIRNANIITGTPGNLTGSYKVASTLTWDGSTTSYVSHDSSLGLLNEVNSPNSTQGSLYWNAPVPDVTLDKTADTKPLLENSITFDLKTKSLWRWSNTSPVLVNNDNVIPSGLQSIGHYSRVYLGSNENLVSTNVRSILSGNTLAANLDILNGILATISPTQSITVTNRGQLRSSAPNQNTTAFISDINLFAYYDVNSTLADNDYNVYKPNSVATNAPGRWIVSHNQTFFTNP